MATNSQRVVYNTAVQIGARAITSVIGVITVGIVTRYLGADLYGQLTAAAIFVGLISTFTDAGLGSATIREIAQKKKSPEEILGTTLLLRMLIAVVATAIGVGLALLIYRGQSHDSTRYGILLLSLTILLATLQSSVTAGLIAVLRNDLIVVGDIAGKVTSLALIVLAIQRHQGFSGIVLAYVIGAAVNATSDLAFGLHRFIPRLHIDLAYWKEMLRIAIPLGITGILGTLYFRADGFLLSLLRTNTEVGLYGAAYKVVEVTMAIPVFFAASSFPILAAAHDDLERVSGLTRRSFVMMSLVAAPIVIGTIVMAPQLAIVLGGRGYAAAAVPMAILMVGNYFSFFNAVFGNSLIATNNQKRLIPIFLTTLLVNIGLNLIVIPIYGAAGAATAVILSELLTLLMLRRSNAAIGVHVPAWRSQLPALGCGLVMGAAVLYAKSLFAEYIHSNLWLLLASVAVGVVTYTILGLVTRVIDTQEIRLILKPGSHE